MELKSLFLNKTVISVAGASGTGKTTLAQYLVGNCLTKSEPYEDCCAWVQASESFPYKRLFKMFEGNKNELNYLKGNIFVIPKGSPCSSFDSLAELLRNIAKKDNLLPPNVKFIVIDNISHHLRYKISKYQDVVKVSAVLDDFFTSLLFPLVMRCVREKIVLILIHEVSYDPATNQTLAFFHKLYDRIDSTKVFLEKQFGTRDKLAKIMVNSSVNAFSYELADVGFVFKG